MCTTESTQPVRLATTARVVALSVAGVRSGNDSTKASGVETELVRAVGPQVSWLHAGDSAQEPLECSGTGWQALDCRVSAELPSSSHQWKSPLNEVAVEARSLESRYTRQW